MEPFDVAVVGAGPAGSTCAALAARHGLRTLLLERTFFPRHKVCGDCLNPGCWETFERLGVARRVRALPHAELATVAFESRRGRRLEVRLPGGPPEIAVRRSELDAVLLEAATLSGAVVRQGETLVRLARMGATWALDTDHGAHLARFLVAADGRNSTVCRLARIAPPVTIGRLAVQAHAPMEAGLEKTVLLRLLDHGYAGVAPVDEDEINICLVSAPVHLPAVRRWAEERFGLDAASTEWHSVAPLARRPVDPVHPGMLLVGDAARVVEPFTGEGIRYALATGSLAADVLAEAVRSAAGGDADRVLASFRRRHRETYRRRLWVNRIARLAVTRPSFGDAVLGMARRFPSVLGTLTAKVVGS